MNPIELYYSLSPYPLADFASFFTRLERSAFRLEMLDLYTVPEESEPYAVFRRGDPKPPLDFNKEWHDILAKASVAGKRFSRVRLVDELASEYLRFEVKWGYETNVLKGEEISFVMRPDISSLMLRVPILRDYWLFDESTCFLMDYDYCGRFLGVVRLPDALVPQYVTLMHELKAMSMSMGDAKRVLGLS